MPVEKNQKLTLVDYPDKGVNTNLDPGTQIIGETILRISCDSKTCTKSVQWILETAGENAENVPDDAYRILILEQFGGQKSVFCSSDCLRRWLKNYVTPLSPNEQAKIDAHNKAIEDRQVFETPDGGTVTKEELMAPEKAFERGSAMSQPDGFAEEVTSE